MRTRFRRQPSNTPPYRSNQWKGTRALQSTDCARQFRQTLLGSRCRRALCVSGWFLSVVALCWLGVMAAYRVGPLLQRGLEVRDVFIEGTHQVTKQEVLDRLALRKGIAQHQVSLAYLAERVRSHPWIKEAMVERLLLHALRITIVERTPAAIARVGAEQVLTDEEGVVLARLGGHDQTALPLLVGVDGKFLAQGDLRVKQRIQSSIELAKWMTESLEGRIEIDVSHPVNLVASARGVRFHFGSGALKEQWERFMTVRAAFKMPGLDSRKSEGHDVDLRYDHRVIVRERG
jgi:cell division protein FtsQ